MHPGELLARGIRPAAIGRRVQAGLLQPTGRGIYIVEELTNPGTPLHHAAPHGFNRRVAGVSIHRRRRPTPTHDLKAIDGLPVTGPALTIVDLAAVVGQARLRHVVHTRISVGRPTLDELVACFDATARRGVNGIASLRLVLAPLVDDNPTLGSVLERKVAALLDEYGIAGFRARFVRRGTTACGVSSISPIPTRGSFWRPTAGDGTVENRP